MKSVVNKITPDKQEEKALKKAAKHFTKKLNKELKHAKAILGGSVAKKTFLKGSYDIDVFVQFDKKHYQNKDISKILHEKLKKINNSTTKISGLHKIHGSRDYFQVTLDPFTFEIIPILRIKKAEEAENITDISPLHTKWVKKKGRRLTSEIRLAKAFCKANKLYGAESYIRGFSGYTLEILTIAHKSFENLMKSAARWKPNTRIDIGKHGVKNLNKSKLSPLIVIDPVQQDRNTSAALSEKKFNEFIALAKTFLHNPSTEFFQKTKFDLEKIKSASILRIAPLNGKEDVIGAKLIKAMDYIARKLKSEGYEIHEHDWHWDNKEAFFWYFTKQKSLSEKKKHYGPPSKEKAHIQEFKKKYSHYPLRREGSRTYVELKRKHVRIDSYLKHLIKSDNYIQDKVKEIKVL
jgi:tRNA nucleotidyltransferase (CCA-adding enzyme)